MALAVIEKMGGLDILINCAGVLFDGDVLRTYPQDFDYLMDINLRCSFHMVLMFNKYLASSRGCIVNVSGTWGSMPKQNFMGYSVCKAGLEHFTKCSALELAPLGVRVNCVSPATVDTNMYLYMGMSQPQYNRFKDEAKMKIPLWQNIAKPHDNKYLEPRIGNVADIANAIIFLTSE